LKTQPDNSAKLATEMDRLNDWNNVSIICWNWKTRPPMYSQSPWQVKLREWGHHVTLLNMQIAFT